MKAHTFSLVLGLAQFFPLIFEWLDGKASPKIIRDIARIAQTLTGQNNENDIVSALRSNPSMLLAFQKEMMRLEMQLRLAPFKDRQDARKRDLQLIHSGHLNRRADVMILGSVMGLTTCLCILIFYHGQLSGEAIGVVSTIAGIFGSCLKDVYAFEFGSSRGSKEKDLLAASLLEQEKSLAFSTVESLTQFQRSQTKNAQQHSNNPKSKNNGGL